MNKYWYNWDEMCKDVNSLRRDIILDKFDPEVIVGLSRGDWNFYKVFGVSPFDASGSHDVTLVPQTLQTYQDFTHVIFLNGKTGCRRRPTNVF